MNKYTIYLSLLLMSCVSNTNIDMNETPLPRNDKNFDYELILPKNEILRIKVLNKEITNNKRLIVQIRNHDTYLYQNLVNTNKIHISLEKKNMSLFYDATTKIFFFLDENNNNQLDINEQFSEVSSFDNEGNLLEISFAKYIYRLILKPNYNTTFPEIPNYAGKVNIQNGTYIAKNCFIKYIDKDIMEKNLNNIVTVEFANNSAKFCFDWDLDGIINSMDQLIVNYSDKAEKRIYLSIEDRKIGYIENYDMGYEIFLNLENRNLQLNEIVKY